MNINYFVRVSIAIGLAAFLIIAIEVSAAADLQIRSLDWSKLQGGAAKDELAAMCSTVMEHSQNDMGKDWLEKVNETKRVGELLDFGYIDPKGRLTGKGIDHQLTVNFGPGGPFNRTLFIKAEGVCPIISSHSMIKRIKLSYPKHIDLVPNEMEHI